MPIALRGLVGLPGILEGTARYAFGQGFFGPSGSQKSDFFSSKNPFFQKSENFENAFFCRKKFYSLSFAN